MMKFLSKKKKGPVELVASTDRNIKVLASGGDGKEIQRSTEKLSHNLSHMKFQLYGDGDAEAKPENMKKLVDELFRLDQLWLMLEHIQKFEFEARKDVAQIYNFVLKQRKEEMVDYIKKRPQVLEHLVAGYAVPDIALNCGSILREVTRCEELNSLLLNNPALFNCFFDYVQLSTFDVSSDAFATFKCMLTKHKKSCSEFLDTNYTEVFGRYNQLLKSDNYVTKRQSLKLLGELLLARANFPVMIKYINSPENLKIMMQLLKGTTKAIQGEAFHVFKIFVANPKKQPPVLEILILNKEKLMKFLSEFQKDKEDDDQLKEEKAILLATLNKLDESMLEPVNTGTPAAASPAPAPSPAPGTT